MGSRLIRSPFREDKKPTCGFYYSKSGRLYLHDFGTEEHFDCIEIVKRKYDLSYSKALEKIIQDREHFSIMDPVKRDEVSIIEFTLGTQKSLKYFHEFSITNPTLEAYKVFPAKTVYKNSKVMARSTKDDPVFIYIMPSGRVKIYRPLTSNSENK